MMQTKDSSDDIVSLLWQRLTSAADYLNRILLSLPSESKETIVEYWRRSSKLLGFTILGQCLPVAAVLVLYLGYSETKKAAPFQIPQFLALASALLLVLIPLWNIMRWFYTVYVLTEERVFLQRGIVARKKLEAPLNKVETATLTTQGPIHKFLDIGSVQLATASRQDDLIFADVDDPHLVESIIAASLHAYKKKAQTLRKSEIVDGLGRHMVEEKPIDEVLRTKSISLPRLIWHKHPYVLVIGISMPLIAILLAAVPPALLRWFAPRLYEQLEFTVWFALSGVVSGVWALGHLWGSLRRPTSNGDRREPLAHRRALWEQAGYRTQFLITVLSMLFVFTGIILGVAILAGDWLGFSLPGLWIPLWVPPASYLVFLAAWLGLRALDWWNDKYTLTIDDITDEMRIPMVYERKTKAPLAKVQDVRADVSFLGRLLGFGDVTVQTAGGGQPIVFPSILHPLDVQDAIFEYMDAQNQRDRANQQFERQKELSDWLDAYRTLTFPPCDPPIHWPSSQNMAGPEAG